MRYKIIKISLLVLLGFVLHTQTNAQLCGQYGVTLNITDSENKPVENAFVQLLTFQEDQTKGKTFVRDEKVPSKFTVKFSEGHQISNTYRLLIWANGFETFEQELRFPHCKQQEFNIKLPTRGNFDYAIVSGTIKFGKEVLRGRSKSENELLQDVYIRFQDENGKNFSTISDKDGNYKIELPIGTYDVYAAETKANCQIPGCAAEFYKRDFLITEISNIKFDFHLSFSGEG